MLTKVFTKNKNDKIEFTEKELKELLDEIYECGYREGKGEKTYTYIAPNWWTLQKPYYTYCTTTINGGDYSTTTSDHTISLSTSAEGENK